MRIGTCHVIIRETLDWERAGIGQLVSPFMRQTASLWDRTFQLGYAACRARGLPGTHQAHRPGGPLCVAQRPDLVSRLWGHEGAVRYLQAERPPVKMLGVPLSVVNRHPCSQLVLGRIMRSVGTEDAALALWRLVKHYVNCLPNPIPPEYRWASTHVARVRDVFHDALRRR